VRVGDGHKSEEKYEVGDLEEVPAVHGWGIEAARECQGQSPVDGEARNISNNHWGDEESKGNKAPEEGGKAYLNKGENKVEKTSKGKKNEEEKRRRGEEEEKKKRRRGEEEEKRRRRRRREEEEKKKKKEKCNTNRKTILWSLGLWIKQATVPSRKRKRKTAVKRALY
jgi:hypothetical protein